jgi:hypothetical protein
VFAAVETLCDNAPAGAGLLRAVVASLARQDNQMAQVQGQSPRARLARQRAEQVLALIGKDNAVADCERLGAILREIGAQQDRTLAVCRMKARWLKETAAMLAENHPGDADLAAKVQVKIDEVLRTK